MPEVPVLSHAERRRQKKKANEPSGDAGKPKKETKGDGKRQNSVWVGNLVFKTTPDALRKFFDGVGEITRIHMPMKAGSKPGVASENRG
jgi:RNA recognition motif-containing protein